MPISQKSEKGGRIKREVGARTAIYLRLPLGLLSIGLFIVLSIWLLGSYPATVFASDAQGLAIEHTAFAPKVQDIAVEHTAFAPEAQSLTAKQTLLTALEVFEHEHDSEKSLQESASIGEILMEALMYTSRIGYYFTLLLAAGAMLLSLSIPKNESGAGQRILIRGWSGPITKSFFMAALVFIFLASNEIVRELGGGAEQFGRLFLETSSGRIWLALLGLAIAGLAMPKLPEVVQAAWAMLLLAAESFNGHAAAAERAETAILFDFIHLSGAAIWAGGVMLLLLFWRTDRKEAGRFAERFAAIAWIAIAALTASGLVLTFTLLPSWLYLIYTDWGRWLIVKTAAAALVVVLGTALRRRAIQREMPRGKLLKWDGVLMAVIVLIASIFTWISPAPESNPVSLHQMGDKLHYTLKLAPNAPGPNDVSLTVWLPLASGEPERVSLTMVPLHSAKGGTINVSFQNMEEAASGIAFPGFAEYRYAVEGMTFPRRGEWKAVLTVVDGKGAEIKREELFSN
ncbi:copper resistance D family protein [Paenibacillus sp. GCM10027627]